MLHNAIYAQQQYIKCADIDSREGAYQLFSAQESQIKLNQESERAVSKVEAPRGDEVVRSEKHTTLEDTSIAKIDLQKISHLTHDVDNKLSAFLYQSSQSALTRPNFGEKRFSETQQADFFKIIMTRGIPDASTPAAVQQLASPHSHSSAATASTMSQRSFASQNLPSINCDQTHHQGMGFLGKIDQQREDQKFTQEIAQNNSTNINQQARLNAEYTEQTAFWRGLEGKEAPIDVQKLSQACQQEETISFNVKLTDTIDDVYDKIFSLFYPQHAMLPLIAIIAEHPGSTPGAPMLLELIPSPLALKSGGRYKFFELAPDNELNAFLFDPKASLPYLNERDQDDEGSVTKGIFDRPDDRIITKKGKNESTSTSSEKQASPIHNDDSLITKNSRSIAPVRPFKCEHPNCNLSFLTKGHLKTHQLNHSEDKPFKCTICGISYSQKSRLQIHVRKHLGIKPYECTYCGNKFTEKGNLNVHLKSHFGHRSYQCEVCNQQFITKGHLEDHVRRHNKDRKFKCESCGSEFYRSTQLKNHQKNQIRCVKSRLNREYEEKFFNNTSTQPLRDQSDGGSSPRNGGTVSESNESSTLLSHIGSQRQVNKSNQDSTLDFQSLGKRVIRESSVDGSATPGSNCLQAKLYPIQNTISEHGIRKASSQQDTDCGKPVPNIEQVVVTPLLPQSEKHLINNAEEHKGGNTTTLTNENSSASQGQQNNCQIGFTKFMRPSPQYRFTPPSQEGVVTSTPSGLMIQQQNSLCPQPSIANGGGQQQMIFTNTQAQFNQSHQLIMTNSPPTQYQLIPIKPQASTGLPFSFGSSHIAYHHHPQQQHVVYHHVVPQHQPMLMPQGSSTGAPMQYIVQQQPRIQQQQYYQPSMVHHFQQQPTQSARFIPLTASQPSFNIPVPAPQRNYQTIPQTPQPTTNASAECSTRGQ